MVKYDSMEGDESLARLRRICGIGSWISLIASLALVCILLVNVVILSIGATDPNFCLPTLTHTQTCISSMEDVLFCAFNVILCLIAYRILKQTSVHYTPFTRDNVVGMKVMSVICLVAFAIILLAQVFMLIIMDADEFFVEFPLEFIVIAVITYVFALLIEYGTALQTESDHFL